MAGKVKGTQVPRGADDVLGEVSAAYRALANAAGELADGFETLRRHRQRGRDLAAIKGTLDELDVAKNRLVSAEARLAAAAVLARTSSLEAEAAVEGQLRAAARRFGDGPAKRQRPASRKRPSSRKRQPAAAIG